MDDDILCEDELDFATWKRHILSAEASERSYAANRLPTDAGARAVIPHLLRCLDDVDAFVRTCAAGTLRHFPRPAIRRRLAEKVDVETDELTISYLLSSLGEIGGLAEVPILLRHAQPKVSRRVRLSAAYGLQCCAENIAKTQFISALNSSYDSRRRSAANLIRHTIDKRYADAEDLIATIQKRLDNEQNPGVADTFENTLHELRYTYDEDEKDRVQKRETDAEQTE